MKQKTVYTRYWIEWSVIVSIIEWIISVSEVLHDMTISNEMESFHLIENSWLIKILLIV